MLMNRCIRKSLYNFIVDLFTNPASGTEWAPFNVYSENQLRQMRSGNFNPVSPFVFVVDSNIAPTQQELPLIVVETTTMTRTYELGNVKGRLVRANLHVFGQNRGVRDDFANYLQDVMAGSMDGAARAIPIYNYHSSGSSTLLEYGQVIGEVAVVDMNLGGAVKAESSLSNWSMVTFTFTTKN